MLASSLLTCLWPGLPRLWWRGDWRALFIAIGFAAVLNLFWVSTFVWPELLPGAAQGMGWTVLLVIWAAAIWHGRMQLARWANVDEFRDGNALFVQAQQEYLQGHWYEAESLLRELAEMHDRDADCRLMLAALYRRTERYEEARELLDRLSRMEKAERWRSELARERRLLDELEPSDDASVETTSEQDESASLGVEAAAGQGTKVNG